MSLSRDITTVGGGTLASRLLAYVRDAWIAALLGAGPYSEALFAVFQVINFFRRLLSEGALNGAFVPIWTKLRGGTNGAINATHFTWRVLLMMFCAAGSIGLLTVFFGHYVIAAIAPGFDDAQQSFAAFLLFMAAPYILFAGLVAVLAAALSAEGRVGAVAVTTILFNLTMLLALLLLPSEQPEPIEGYLVAFTLASAVTAAGIVQLVAAGIAWLWNGKRLHRSGSPVRDETGAFFRRTVPGLIATGIPQLKLIAATAIVSASPAAVSWLYYANRLYELPLGIASITVAAVIVPRIAGSVHARDEAQFVSAQSRAYEVALGLALPAATGFAILAEPIARGLFERGAFDVQDTAAVAAALMAICAGLPGHVLEKVFGAVSFAHEDTHTPMLSALAGFGAAIIGGVLLFPRLGYIGVAAAIAMSGWVGAGLLGTLLFRRRWLQIDANARHRLPRICFATITMAGAVGYANHVIGAGFASSPARLAILAALVTLGVAVYLAGLLLLGVVAFRELAVLQRKS
jgi:putative peptidoglycan lipid II flippase